MGCWGDFPDERDDVCDRYSEMIDDMEKYKTGTEVESGLGDRLGIRMGGLMEENYLSNILDYDFIFDFILDEISDDNGWWGDSSDLTRSTHGLGLLTLLIRNLTNVDYGIFIQGDFKDLPKNFPVKVHYLGRQLVRTVYEYNKKEAIEILLKLFDGKIKSLDKDDKKKVDDVFAYISSNPYE